MYKRRDWLHLHGEDGGASDSSDDGDSDSHHEGNDMAEANAGSDSDADSQELGAPQTAAAAASDDDNSSDDSSNPEEGSPAGYESEVSEPVGMRRLEDLSEEDFDSGQDDEDLEELKESWLESTDATADHKPAGRALKCRACDGKLLLNALALQQHIASKRHLRKAKGTGENPTDPICFADQLANDENVETHQERIQRLQQSEQPSSQPLAPQPQALSKGSGAAKRRRRQQRLEAGSAPGGSGQKQKKSKLGKRQRAALKQGKQEAAADPAGSLASKHREAKRHKPSACVAVSS